MPSQTDLDQGGTFRQNQQVWLGPSIGWVEYPITAILNITAAGVFTIARGTTMILINVNGNVTLNLPSSKASVAGASVIPGNSVITPTIITDQGGFALSNTYTINPNGSELISGLASIKLASAFGTVLLEPLIANGGWNLGQ